MRMFNKCYIVVKTLGLIASDTNKQKNTVLKSTMGT